MKSLKIVLLTLLFEAVAASPAANLHAPGLQARSATEHSASTALQKRAFDPEKDLSPEKRKARDQMVEEALKKDDHDWTQAYTMDPIVEDIDCDHKEHKYHTGRFYDCETKCRTHFEEKMTVLGVPISNVQSKGVWGYHFFNWEECPRRACWMRMDWDRKEKVLAFKTGSPEADLSDAAEVLTGDVEVNGAFAVSVKGASQFYCK